MDDIRDDPGFNPNQHCTYPDQNGADDEEPEVTE